MKQKLLSLLMLLLMSPLAWAVDYNLYVAGVRVTSSNATNLSTIPGVSGTVGYLATRNTLALNDATISLTTTQGIGALMANIDGLKIQVTGDCTIECNGGVGMLIGAVSGTSNVSLTGSGTLTVKGTSGVQLANATSQLICNGPTLRAYANAEGGHGICGRNHSGTTYYGTLTVNKGKVTAMGYSEIGGHGLNAGSSSIDELLALNLGDGMCFTSPSSAQFQDHAVRNASGTAITSAVTIQKIDAVPLTLEAKEAGTVSIKNPCELSIGYALSGGAITWSSDTLITVSLATAQRLELYGDNATYSYVSNPSSKHTNIQCSADCYVFGNIMSLISSSAYENLKELTANATFYNLFNRNEHILNHPLKPLLLPATTLRHQCYSGMFSGCSGLTAAPELPATVLESLCYNSMFSSCTNLTTAPALPALTLEWMCYGNMFYRCSSLTEAPALPATTLAEDCYYRMFSQCTSLTEAPELPAATLVTNCYYGMFEYCSNLTYIKCLATDLANGTGTQFWVDKVSPTGTFVKAYGFNGWGTGVNSIPSGWTVEEDDSKEPCDLAFSAETLTLNYGDELTEPTLTNPHNVAVTYTSSNTAVATVDSSTGKLTIRNAGTTTITASFPGDESVYAGSARYVLTVTSAGQTPTLAFDRQGIVVKRGATITAPTLTASPGLSPTYVSSNNSVVNVNAQTGQLSFNGLGVAVITASTPATLQYAAATARYYVMVVDNPQTILGDVNTDGTISITDVGVIIDMILSE